VVLISQNDTIISSKAKGYSDFENKTELETSDLFVIGSISKQITAVLVLKEMENGALKPELDLRKAFR
jgi:D-alanyl-D-alanine carboxypeptidase